MREGEMIEINANRIQIFLNIYEKKQKKQGIKVFGNNYTQ